MMKSPAAFAGSFGPIFAYNAILKSCVQLFNCGFAAVCQRQKLHYTEFPERKLRHSKRNACCEQNTWLPRYRRMTNRVSSAVIRDLSGVGSYTSVARKYDLSVTTVPDL